MVIFTLFGAIALSGCHDSDPTLEEAIDEYLTIRHQSGKEFCSCYQLFIDLSDPDAGPFSSEEECLAAIPEPSTQGASCIKQILDSGPYDTTRNIGLMQCYTAAIRGGMDCFASKVAEGCSDTAQKDCELSASKDYKECAGEFTNDQAEAIIYCTVE